MGKWVRLWFFREWLREVFEDPEWLEEKRMYQEVLKRVALRR